MCNWSPAGVCRTGLAAKHPLSRHPSGEIVSALCCPSRADAPRRATAAAHVSSGMFAADHAAAHCTAHSRTQSTPSASFVHDVACRCSDLRCGGAWRLVCRRRHPASTWQHPGSARREQPPLGRGIRSRSPFRMHSVTNSAAERSLDLARWPSSACRRGRATEHACLLPLEPALRRALLRRLEPRGGAGGRRRRRRRRGGDEPLPRDHAGAGGVLAASEAGPAVHAAVQSQGAPGSAAACF